MSEKQNQTEQLESGRAIGSALTREEALSAALMMSYEEQRARLIAAGWSNDGDWDTWFCPDCGWNYDSVYAVAKVLMQSPNSGSALPTLL